MIIGNQDLKDVNTIIIRAIEHVCVSFFKLPCYHKYLIIFIVLRRFYKHSDKN